MVGVSDSDGAVRQDDNKFIIPEGIFLGIPEGRAQNFFR